MSLAKEPSGQWKEMGYWVTNGKRLTDWVKGEGGLKHSSPVQFASVSGCGRANCTPTVHICESGGTVRHTTDRYTNKQKWKANLQTTKHN